MDIQSNSQNVDLEDTSEQVGFVDTSRQVLNTERTDDSLQPPDEELTDVKQVASFFPTLSDSSEIKDIVPKRFQDSFRILDTGSTQELWVYVEEDQWRKVSLS